MLIFPKKLEEALLHYVKKTFYIKTKRAHHIDKPFDKVDIQFFSKGVAELSNRFTSERSRLKSDYLNQPSLRAGYLLYFLPINFTKALYLFSELPKFFWKQKSFRLLDLGSGPATASLAFLSQLAKIRPGSSVEIHLVDQNKNILRDAAELIKISEKILTGIEKIKLKIHNGEVVRFRPSGQYDLIVLNHLLNEMVQLGAKERADWLLPHLKNHLKNTGLLALLEPALKRPARELMALRDHLVESGEFTVLSPCLHEKICPMLAGTKNDWCHFYIDWEEPDYLKKLDRMIGNDNRFLKLAYVVLGKKEEWQEQLDRPAELFRVVSNRMATRGKTEIVLCGLPGRIRLSRLDRDRSEANRAIDFVRRGDLLRIPQFSSKKYQVDFNLRLTKKSRLGGP